MARYTIRQLELGYDNAFPLGIAFDMWDHAGEQAYSPFSVTLLEGEGHKILFDCGFDPESAFAKAKIAQENDQNCHDTQAVLRANGVDPAEIDTVIIGHCHWDHLNGLKYFPNAKIYVQEEEVRRWSAAMKNPSFPITHKMVVDTECLELLEDWVAQGKVTTLKGDVDGLLPGIHVRRAAGHSFAQNLLFVEEERGNVAIVGDAAMRPESFTGSAAFPCYLPNLKFAVGTIEDIVGSYDKIMAWVGGDVDAIVTCHDGTLPQRRRSVENALGLHAYLVRE